MARSFRIGRMALTMHGGAERGGQGTLGRLSLALLPARRPPPSAASTALIVEERTPADAARERARRALLDAQREMGGLLAGAPAALPAPSAQPVDELVAQLAQHRTRLGDLEGERGRLRAEVEQLRGTLATVAVRLDQMERRLESPLTRPAEEPPHPEAAAEPTASHAAGPPHIGSPPSLAAGAAPMPSAPPAEHAPAIAEDHQRALEGRVFAAGNVGALLRIAPPPASGVADLAARLAADPSVDHVEIQAAEADAAVLRITFKLPCRWPALRELLGRALGRELAPGEAGWFENAVHLRPAAAERR